MVNSEQPDDMVTNPRSQRPPPCYHYLLLVTLFAVVSSGGSFLPPPTFLPTTTSPATKIITTSTTAMRQLLRPQRLLTVMRAVVVGDWVIVHETGTVARVVSSSSKGWWRLEDTKSRHIFSARTGSFSRTTSPSNSTTTTTATGSLESLMRLKSEDYPRHACTITWMAFSDLHCSPTSLSVCQEVLRKVNEEARKRQAGVIFLGDFWHLRGEYYRRRRSAVFVCYDRKSKGSIFLIRLLLLLLLLLLLPQVC